MRPSRTAAATSGLQWAGVGISRAGRSLMSMRVAVNAAVMVSALSLVTVERLHPLAVKMQTGGGATGWPPRVELLGDDGGLKDDDSAAGVARLHLALLLGREVGA